MSQSIASAKLGRLLLALICVFLLTFAVAARHITNDISTILDQLNNQAYSHS